LAEWGLVALVVVALMAVLGRQVRTVQSQAERAAVQTTLGALRTALVLSQVTGHVAGVVGTVGAGGAALPQNPFLLLKTVPTNFAGAHSMARADGMSLGAWVFDGECVCVGYRLLYPDVLNEPEGAEAVWFRVGGPAGALLITPLTRYVWQGQLLG